MQNDPSLLEVEGLKQGLGSTRVEAKFMMIKDQRYLLVNEIRTTRTLKYHILPRLMMLPLTPVSSTTLTTRFICCIDVHKVVTIVTTPFPLVVVITPFTIGI